MTEHGGLFKRIGFKGQPDAHPDSIVVCGKARFTILTPRLIRLEWSDTGQFEDRGTFAFPTRFAAPPAYTARTDSGTLVIDTGPLALRYRQEDHRLSSDNVSIAFSMNTEQRIWVPGLADPSNLRGTRRTLDECRGDAALEEGLLSRAGWAVFDDSQSVVFDPGDGWVYPRPDHDLQDWYFFGYGHAYKEALADYIRFGGPIPLIPRFVLGAWWSRYWAYSDQDLRALVHAFEEHDLPLDVLVIDMDWHTPHSWTGYTWNRELFPDPPAFLRWVHSKGLRVSLNLHPAEGIQAFEEAFPQFAQAMDLDPDSVESIPFRISDRRFVKNYFELLHHPLEDDGVDFWWVDWQQGETSEIAGLDPLPWLNHLHFSDSSRRCSRPLVYSRWGGLGNHRYQTGFSGDTYVGWPALQFQPYFSATASNVAYGWWGHDIGGHMGGATDPELYARWVQFGALSPCLRLHATKDPRAERRPWRYPEEVFQAARAAFRWRYQLVPYIYTMARVAHDTGVSLCRPMYYEYPEEEDAYVARYQYFFGDQMIAAPIVHPADPDTGLATTDVWLPEGTWIDYASKETFTGPGWFRLVGDLHRVPMLMRAGAILPLAAPFAKDDSSSMASGTTDAIPDDRVCLSVFPGAHGRFRLYEDDGESQAYQAAQFEWTEITTRIEDANTWAVHLAPVQGKCAALPRQRAYEIRLEGSRRPQKVLLDGMQVSNWNYDSENLRTSIYVPLRDKGKQVTVTALAEDGISALGPARDQSLAKADAARLLADRNFDGRLEASELAALARTETPGLADAIGRLGGPFVRFLEYSTPEEARQCLGRLIAAAPTCSSTPFDLTVTWTLCEGSDKREYISQIEGATETIILDSPFAFDGRVQTGYWEAEARLAWAGVTLIHTRRSSMLFPSIYAWHAIVYNQDEEPLTLEQVIDDRGQDNAQLPWRSYFQSSQDLVNVTQPHGVHLSREHRQALQAGQSLAAYLFTTVTSPHSRQAILEFSSAGPVEIYLDGQRVLEAPVEPEAWLPGTLPRKRSTATMYLRAGKNALTVHTKPPQEKRPWWYFGGQVRTPEGELMGDLAFE